MHCKGLRNPCTICKCHLLQEPVMHWDVQFQCNKSDPWVSKHWHWWLQSAAGTHRKSYGQEINGCFQKFRLRSLLLELSLLYCDQGRHKETFALYEHSTECTRTQQTFTNPVLHYNGCKLLNSFLDSNLINAVWGYSLARYMYLPLAGWWTTHNSRNTVCWFSSRNCKVLHAFSFESKTHLKRCNSEYLIILPSNQQRHTISHLSKSNF